MTPPKQSVQVLASRLAACRAGRQSSQHWCRVHLSGGMALAIAVHRASACCPCHVSPVVMTLSKSRFASHGQVLLGVLTSYKSNMFPVTQLNFNAQAAARRHRYNCSESISKIVCSLGRTNPVWMCLCCCMQTQSSCQCMAQHWH